MLTAEDAAAAAGRLRRADEALARPRTSQTLTLRSCGARVSFADAGDPCGFPVLWFAGPAANRLVAALFDDDARAHGLRILCFDRPGRGASSPLKHPKTWHFAAWADYIEELTEMLNIKQFSLIGHSIGATYALGCYLPLQHKIVGTLRLLAPWAPSNLPCMPVSYAVQRSLPKRLLREIYSVSYNNSSWFASSTSPSSSRVPTQLGTIGIRERENAQDPFVYQILERMAQDCMGDGYKAFELDWLLALEVDRPFGFDHRKIPCAVKCWHGMDDSIVPLGAAMWLQREMKQFLLYAVEGATNNIFLDFAIMKAVFADIAKEVLPLRPCSESAVGALDVAHAQSGDGMGTDAAGSVNEKVHQQQTSMQQDPPSETREQQHMSMSLPPSSPLKSMKSADTICAPAAETASQPQPDPSPKQQSVDSTDELSQLPTPTKSNSTDPPTSTNVPGPLQGPENVWAS